MPHMLINIIILTFQTSSEDGSDDQYIVKLDDSTLRKAFSNCTSTSTGGAFRLKPDIPPQYLNIFNIDNQLEGGDNTSAVAAGPADNVRAKSICYLITSVLYKLTTTYWNIVLCHFFPCSGYNSHLIL